MHVNLKLCKLSLINQQLKKKFNLLSKLYNNSNSNLTITQQQSFIKLSRDKRAVNSQKQDS